MYRMYPWQYCALALPIRFTVLGRYRAQIWLMYHICIVCGGWDTYSRIVFSYEGQGQMQNMSFV